MSYRNIVVLLVILAVLGVVYFVVSRPEPEEPSEPTVYIWDIDMDEIEHIVIELPHQGMSQAFIKIPQGDQFPWFFDDGQNSPINQEKWGGGITLLLSGPAADRVINEDATAEEFARYGLDEPSMIITLILADETTVIINLGDSTPNGINYYIQAPNTNAVATVDFTWYDVLSGLVTNPPYASAEE